MTKQVFLNLICDENSFKVLGSIYTTRKQEGDKGKTVLEERLGSGQYVWQAAADFVTRFRSQRCVCWTLTGGKDKTWGVSIPRTRGAMGLT